MTIIIFQLFSGGHKPGGISIFFISNYLNEKLNKRPIQDGFDVPGFPSRIKIYSESIKPTRFCFFTRLEKSQKRLFFKS